MSEPNLNELLESHNIDPDTNSMLLTIEEEDWVGVCNPQIEEENPHTQAPFDFDTMGDAPSTEEVAQTFSEMFDEQVEQVYQQVEKKDDPLQTIMDMDMDELISENTEATE